MKPQLHKGKYNIAMTENKVPQKYLKLNKDSLYNVAWLPAHKLILTEIEKLLDSSL